MKTILLICFMPFALLAQNAAVRWYPVNQPYSGLTNWPAQVQPTGAATTVPNGFATNMPLTALQAHVAARQAAYDAGESNAVYQARQAIQADVNVLVVAYSNLQWVADNFVAVTNTANIRTAIKACGDVLLKMKPVLTEMYQGQQR
jgi:hypothetical protein